MKKALLFILLSIFILPSFAQKGDDCPAVDWVETTNLDSNRFIIEQRIGTKDAGEVLVGYYFPGCQSIYGKSVPVLDSNITYSLSNMFLMRLDSNENAEWILPFEITDFYNRPTLDIIAFYWSIALDEEDNIHIVVTPYEVEFNVLGNKYGYATSMGRDRNFNAYQYYFKIDKSGKLKKEFSIKNYSGNHPTGNYFFFNLLKANAQDSSLIIVVHNTADIDTLLLYNGQKISSGLYDNHIVKVNAQFQIQWIKEMSNCYLNAFVEGKNKNDFFIIGSFAAKPNTGPGHFYSKVFIDKDSLQTDTAEGGYFITKLNMQSGNFSNSKILLEGSGMPTWFLNTLPVPFFSKNLRNPHTYKPFNKFAVKDENHNVYFVGNFKSEEIRIPQKGTINFGIVKRSRIFLLKYNLVQEQQESFTILGTNLARPYDILYSSKSKQLIVSGDFYEQEGCFLNNDTVIAPINNYNNDGNWTTFLMSLDPNSERQSDYAEWNNELKANWLIYNRYYSDTLQPIWFPLGATVQRMYIDKQDDIHFFGEYIGETHWDWKKLNPGALISLNTGRADVRRIYSLGNYHAKLTALTSHIQHDATRMRAAQENAQYQWYDCGNNMQAVSGATDRYFTPSNVNGKYAVKVSNTWCSVMSDCQKLSVPSVKDLRSVQIYPNPVSNTLYLANLPIGVDITVFDVMGRKVVSSSVQQSSFKINTESWSQGVYLVQLNYQGERWMEKVYHAKGFAR